MRKRIVAASVAAVLAATAVVVSTADAAPLAPTGSGLPWTSGAYLDHSATNISPWEGPQGRNRPLDAIEVFPSRDSQSALLDWSWWTPSVRPVTDRGGMVIITMPLWAPGQSASTDTTALWRQVGQQIQSNGWAGRALVRVGWEMNLPPSDHYWSVTSSNRAAWVTSFRRASTLLRQYAPGVKIAFNPNEGPSQQALADIGTLAGDLAGSFDFAGPDFYNWYPQMDTAAAWATRYNGTYGMKFWEDWAVSHGKGFTVPEWGGAKAYNNSTGVFYAQQMIARFAAMSARVPVIEAYFNEPASYIQNSLWNPQQMPQMAAAYKAALDGVTPTSPPTTSPTVSPSPSC